MFLQVSAAGQGASRQSNGLPVRRGEALSQVEQTIGTYRIGGKMSLADEIRAYVLHHHVEPARRQGVATVSLVSGDLHREMGLDRRLPAVCAALDTPAFLALAGVRLCVRPSRYKASKATCASPVSGRT